jgi:preprotein translocase subunit SecE
MSSTLAPQESKLDVFKLAMALLFVAGGVYAFYYFNEYPQVVRVLGFLVVVGVATGLSLTTEPGRRLVGFVKEADIERRKVVWPTWPETRQTTLAIIAVVVLIALFMWSLDMLLGWLTQSLTR